MDQHGPGQIGFRYSIFSEDKIYKLGFYYLGS